MITTTHPIDYQKRIVLKSQLQRVCLDCGAFAALLHKSWFCPVCDGRNIGEVWEHELEDFRRDLDKRLDEAAHEYPTTLTKVLSTFDNLRPVEDTDHLRLLLAALGVRVMTYEEMFDELAAGTDTEPVYFEWTCQRCGAVLPSTEPFCPCAYDGTDNTSTASRRDAAFRDMGPF